MPDQLSPIDRLRRLVHDCLAKHMHDTAAFYADKLVTFSGAAPAEVYILAQAFYVSQQYRRSIQLMKQTDMIEKDVRFRYLAAKCLCALSDWEACLALLGGDTDEVENTEASVDPELLGIEIDYYSAVCLLKGECYRATDNNAAAVRCYKAAIKADPYCFEALRIMLDQHLLSNSEELAIVDNLGLREDDEWLRLLYRSKCKKYDQLNDVESQLSRLEGHSGRTPDPASPPAVATPARSANIQPMSPFRTGGVLTRSKAREAGREAPHMTTTLAEPNAHGSHMADQQRPAWALKGNADVLACRADVYFHRGAYHDCYALTSSILEQDPYAIECLPLHLVSALELKKKNELFLRAHRLVDEHPTSAVSWFAVGCYYMCTHQFDSARRYFGKATSVDKSFAAAWIGFGHAFAALDESDQALSAYRSAARLFPGLHTPLVGMGMEYSRMNNTSLAEQVFMQSYRMCPANPLVCNEIGVLEYKNGRYEDAIKWLRRALELIPGHITPAWESCCVNLGHAYRKLKQYSDALHWYYEALGLSPGQAGTYSAIGFTYHLQGNYQRAIDHYHKALGLRPDDSFSAEILSEALQQDAMDDDDDDMM